MTEYAREDAMMRMKGYGTRVKVWYLVVYDLQQYKMVLRTLCFVSVTLSKHFPVHHRIM